ncbi:MAG: GPP34 family phosphoprotein [Bacteroidales bacterium]|nr:GPP34 family phosphoprotein [Bacteroidales bacterium]
MELSIARRFFILSLHPANGTIPSSDILFRLPLTGALLIEYLAAGEFSISQRRIVPSFRMNGDPLHDMIAEKISASQKARKISYWISILSNKSRFIKNNLILSLEKDRVIRVEYRKFLGLFSYRRYWMNNPGLRTSLIETLRGILLHGKEPGRDDLMFLAIIESSRSYKLLSRERGEARRMREKCKSLIAGNSFAPEISQAIREVQAAVATAVTVATITTHSSH